MPPVCNKDCLHCPYPDCINDQLDHEDYQALDQMEREILAPPSRKQRRRAAQKRAYYEANREKVAAQQIIRARRCASGYTQNELSALVGVSQAAICLWERCKVPADFDRLEAVFPGITKEATQCPT